MNCRMAGLVSRRPNALCSVLGALLLSACGALTADGANGVPGEGTAPALGDASEGRADEAGAADAAEDAGGPADREGPTGERSEAVSHSNTGITYPYNVQFSDIDGDSFADFVAYSQDYWGYRLSVGIRGPNWSPSSLDVKRLVTFDDFSQKRIKVMFTGRFTGGGQRALCFREGWTGNPESETVECFYLSGDRLERAFFYSPKAPWPSGHKVAVGDFDGDGDDEIFTYNAENGSGGKMWSFRTNEGFAPKPGFSPGALGAVNTPGGVIYHVGNAADGPDGRRDDLMAYHQTTRRLTHYRAHWPSPGPSMTFTKLYEIDGYVGPQDEFMLADANGDGFEDAIIHDKQTGATRFYAADWPTWNGGLAPLPVQQGNLFSGNQTNALFWGNHPGKRDDAFVYLPGSDELLRYYAATGGDGSKTYYWHYSTPMSLVCSVLAMH